MNISEMHLQVDLGLNNLNSSLYGNVLSQEKDWALNCAQLRFVKQKYDPQSNRFGKGLEMSQKRWDDLRNFHVVNYTDWCYITEDSNVYRFPLPSDYMFLTSQRSRSSWNNCLSELTRTTTDSTNYYWTIPLYTEDDTFINFDIKTVSPNTSIFSSTSTFDNYTNTDIELFFIKLQSVLNNSNYNFYWETFSTVYSKNSIIVVWTGANAPTSNDDLKVEFPTIITYEDSSINTQIPLAVGADNTEYVPNRETQIDDVYVINRDPFNKTIYDNPLTISHKNYIDVFCDDSFIVSKMSISYIKFPPLMSLSLAQSCQLSSETHQEIVSLAVNILIENLESRRLGTQTQQLLTEE